MKMLSRVCAEFRNKKGEVVYRVTPMDRLRYIDDAPDAIREDPLFAMLVNDGSIEVVDTPAQRKAMEQDPTAGMDATGRKIVAAGGGSSDDFEVNGVFTAAASGRSKDGETLIKRAVRGTVATIEGAERKPGRARTEKDGKPVAETEGKPESTPEETVKK